MNRFLESLKKQTHQDFELIVVDQNPEEVLTPLLEAHKDDFPIVHVARPNDRGVSKSRNAGINHANGELLTFPDDDCWYPPDLLKTVDAFMQSRPDVDCVSGRMVHQGGESDSITKGQGYFLESPLKVAQIPGPWSLFLRDGICSMNNTIYLTLSNVYPAHHLVPFKRSKCSWISVLLSGVVHSQQLMTRLVI